VSDTDYRLWTLARALGLLGIPDLVAVGSHILDHLPVGDRMRDLPAVCFIVREVIDDDTAWTAVTGGLAAVDWRAIELEVCLIPTPPVTAPSSLVSLVLLHIETSLQARSATN
jgi:hypothetical protein